MAARALGRDVEIDATVDAVHGEAEMVAIHRCHEVDRGPMRIDAAFFIPSLAGL
jgi:hypothetical protein